MSLVGCLHSNLSRLWFTPPFFFFLLQISTSRSWVDKVHENELLSRYIVVYKLLRYKIICKINIFT